MLNKDALNTLFTKARSHNGWLDKSISETQIKEIGINSNTSSNTTYKPTSFDKDEILANHRSFMTSLNGFTLFYDLHKNTILLEALSAGTITYLS
jgi:hypothetical protein